MILNHTKIHIFSDIVSWLFNLGLRYVFYVSPPKMILVKETPLYVIVIYYSNI